jgi:hypothetical protein
MHKSPPDCNGPHRRTTARELSTASRGLAQERRKPGTTMNYILAILLPPVSILLTGRPLLAVIVFIIWLPAIIISGGLTHPMFILLAWFIIFQSRESRYR